MKKLKTKYELKENKKNFFKLRTNWKRIKTVKENKN